MINNRTILFLGLAVATAALNVGYVNNANAFAAQCDATNFDTIVLAFVSTFSADAGLNYTLDGTCTNGGAGCDTLKTAVAKCQANNITVMVSLGGDTGQQSFSTLGAAVLAEEVLTTFFSPSGPIGQLDGLDISLQKSRLVDGSGVAAFIKRFRLLTSTFAVKPLISAAPECPTDDQYMDIYFGTGGLTSYDKGDFDYMFVRFYNNVCGPINGVLESEMTTSVRKWDILAEQYGFRWLMGIQPIGHNAVGTGKSVALVKAALAIPTTPQYLIGMMAWTATSADTAGISAEMKSAAALCIGASNSTTTSTTSSITTSTRISNCTARAHAVTTTTATTLITNSKTAKTLITNSKTTTTDTTAIPKTIPTTIPTTTTATSTPSTRTSGTSRNVAYVMEAGSLAAQCNSANFDTLILAFVYTLSAEAGLTYTLDETCTTGGVDCDTLKSTVAKCQANGKTVIISLGGANGQQTFSTAGASKLAQDVVTTFFTASGPVGKLDGIDIDLEATGLVDGTGVATFVKQFKSLTSSFATKPLVSAAPQCPTDDTYMNIYFGNGGLASYSKGDFDFLNVQFYNNACGPTNGAYDAPSMLATVTKWNTLAEQYGFKWLFGVMPSGTHGVGPGQSVNLIKAVLAIGDSSKYLGGMMVWTGATADTAGISSEMRTAADLC